MENYQNRMSRRSLLATFATGVATLALAGCIQPPAVQTTKQQATTQVKLKDTELFYQVVGTGTPCLVVHGGLGLDHTYFRPALDSLADRLQLIYYDQRGNGRSGRPPVETITLAQLVDDADAVRAAIGAERIALLGHSFGGFVALEYALRYPERVSQLMLIDTAPAFDYAEELQVNVQRKNPSPAVLAAAAAPAPPTDAEFAQLWQTVLPLYFHRYAAEVAARAFAETRYSTAAAARNDVLYPTYNVVARLREIHAPTLVVGGDDDFICPPSQARRLQAGIQHAELAILAECGHFPFIEQPKAFETALRSWLAQVL